MKRYLCDTCKTQEKEQPSGLAPAGWYSVYRNGGTAPDSTQYPFSDRREYCSPACMIAGAHQDIREQSATLAQDARPRQDADDDAGKYAVQLPDGPAVDLAQLQPSDLESSADAAGEWNVDDAIARAFDRGRDSQ